MAVQIDKAFAKSIAKKLKAKIVTSTSTHDMAMVYHGEILIATFGIRRGSKKNSGHDHIPKDLKVQLKFAKELGNCTKYHKDYLRETGRLPAATPRRR